MTIITCYTWGKKHGIWGAQFWQCVLNVNVNIYFSFIKAYT